MEVFTVRSFLYLEVRNECILRRFEMELAQEGWTIKRHNRGVGGESFSKWTFKLVHFFEHNGKTYIVLQNTQHAEVIRRLEGVKNKIDRRKKLVQLNQTCLTTYNAP